MSKAKKKIRSRCPINFGLEAFGDRWALLILRDIVFRGKRTFGEFLKSEEKFATNILTSRLEHLLEEGILTKEPMPGDSRKDVYLLTEKGLDLIPVIFEIALWSYKYDPKSEGKRIPGLMKQIQDDNRQISKEVMREVKRGEGIVYKYLKK